ncbi:hypothetical protein HQ590_11280, partial [bacterium]|nr:hypothetical protein [bacterium]
MVKELTVIRVVALLATLVIAGGLGGCRPAAESPAESGPPAPPPPPVAAEPEPAMASTNATEGLPDQMLTWADIEKLGPQPELAIGAKVYRDIQWLGLDGHGVKFRHAEGEATVPLARLQAALQDRPAPPPEPAPPVVEPPPAPPAPIVVPERLIEQLDSQRPLFVAGETVEVFRRGIGARGTFQGTANQSLVLDQEGERVEIPFAELDAASRVRVDTEYRQKSLEG